MKTVTARKRSGVSGIAPDAIGARQVRPRDAQHDDAEHGQERAERQAELDEFEHRPRSSASTASASRRRAGTGWRTPARRCLVLRANTASSGMSSPMAIVTRGPIHIMALIEDMRPMQISAPTMRPPASPKMCLPATSADVDLAGQLGDRRGVEEDGVERDVEQRSRSAHRDQHRERQVALRDRAISPAM